MENRHVTITINHETYSVEKDRSVLSICNDMGIEIPALCHNEALKPYGACRLCMVEVKNGPQPGSLTASCTLMPENGMEILTETEKIKKYRGLLFEFLLARAPQSNFINELAAKYGVFKTRFTERKKNNDPLNNKCVLCGQCVRVCEEIMGKRAINYIGRGYFTVINAPFHEESNECTGCKACAEVCPTGAIDFRDLNGFRIMESWNSTRISLEKCSVCGRFYSPVPMVSSIYRHISEDLKHTIKNICPECKRKTVSQKQISSSLSF
jgi:NADH dehydrogenase/NADH:ubiquinone oxidoreductase subunit G